MAESQASDKSENWFKRFTKECAEKHHSIEKYLALTVFALSATGILFYQWDNNPPTWLVVLTGITGAVTTGLAVGAMYLIVLFLRGTMANRTSELEEQQSESVTSSSGEASQGSSATFIRERERIFFRGLTSQQMDRLILVTVARLEPERNDLTAAASRNGPGVNVGESLEEQAKDLTTTRSDQVQAAQPDTKQADAKTPSAPSPKVVSSTDDGNDSAITSSSEVPKDMPKLRGGKTLANSELDATVINTKVSPREDLE